MKGYKVFNPDWTCKGKKYSCPGEFVQEGKLELCKNGIHFCKNLIDCFSYYDFSPNNRVAEIEAIGSVIDDEDDKKSCTDRIKIVREIDWYEVLTLVNIGDGNSGDWNSGNGNSGDRNSGDRNSGDWNSGNWNSGVFCVEKNPTIRMFDKESEWTIDDWINSEPARIMGKYKTTTWVVYDDMTIEEKEDYPESKTTGGYLRKNNMQEWWDKLPETDKKAVMRLPNFDADIFMECTGIDVKKNE